MLQTSLVKIKNTHSLLRSGGLLCFISMNAGVRTELADSMVTPGELGGD